MNQVDHVIYVETASDYTSSQIPSMDNNVREIQQSKLLDGKSDSFNIGLLDEKDRDKIPLLNVKPLFVESSFIDDDALEDILGLGKTLDECLYEISSRGPESKIVYFRVRDFENACKISGKYKQQDGQISLSGKIKCGEKEYPMNIKSKGINGLADKIIEIVIKVK